jgi:hypothetical protein
MTKESIGVSAVVFLLTLVVSPIVTIWWQLPPVLSFIFAFVFSMIATIVIAWAYNEYKRRQY